MFTRILLLFGLGVFSLLASTITTTAKWDDIAIPEGCLFVDALSRNGRVACYSYQTQTGLWTAMLSRSQGYRWVLVARDGQAPLAEGETLGTLRQPGKRVCTDEECYFTSSRGAQVSVWKAENLLGRITFTRLLQSGPGVNLDRTGLVLDINRLLVYAEVVPTGKGLYEVTGVQTLRLVAAENDSGTFDWSPNLMLIKEQDFVFKGTKLATNILGKIERRDGLFYLKLGRQTLAQKIVVEHEDKVDGRTVINCDFLSVNPRGFLLGHETPGERLGEHNSFLYFWTPQIGLQRIAKSITKIGDRYIPGVRPVGSTNWGLAPYVVTTWPDGARTEEVRYWLAEEKRSILVMKTGERIAANSTLVNIRWDSGGTTADNRIVVSANVQTGNSSSLRFAVGIRPIPTGLSPLIARPGDLLTIKGSDLFLDGLTTKAWVGPFEAAVTRIGDDAAFRLPASALPGKQPVWLELSGSTGGTIRVEAGEIEVVNTFPLPRITGITSAASFRPGFVCPGCLASLFGDNLSPTGTVAAGVTPLPTELGGVQIFIGNQRAPLLFVSPGQVNFQIPMELTAGQVEVRVLKRFVEGQILQSLSFQLTLQPIAPDIFALANNATGAPITRQNPARYGDFVTVYAAGFGPVSPSIPSGHAAPAVPLFHLVNPPQLKVGGVPRPVLFAGLAPGFVGLYQLNFEVPQGALAEEPVEIAFPGVPSLFFYLPVAPAAAGE